MQNKSCVDVVIRKSFSDFRENPFHSGYNPSLILLIKSHLELLDSIKKSLTESRRLNILLGTSGVGKTTVAEVLIKRLESAFSCRKFDASRFTHADPLRAIFSAVENDRRKDAGSNTRIRFQSMRAPRYMAESRGSLLVIDNAHELSLENVVQIDDLLNRVNLQNYVLRILLIGRVEGPSDLQKLARIGRVGDRGSSINTFHLDPLSVDESKKYIRYRLSVVSEFYRDRVDSETLETIAKLSGGIPAKINKLGQALIISKISDKENSDDRMLNQTADYPTLFNPNPKGWEISGQNKAKDAVSPSGYGEKWAFLKPFMNNESLPQCAPAKDVEELCEQTDKRSSITACEDTNSNGVFKAPTTRFKAFCKYSSLIVFMLLLMGGPLIYFYAPQLFQKANLTLTQIKERLPTTASDGTSGGKKPAVTGSRKGISETTTLKHPDAKGKDAWVQQREKTIRELLGQAKSLIVKGNLITPIGNSALDLYQEILLLEPDHPQAIEGIDNIKSIFVERAKKAKLAKDLKKATLYYRAALSITNNDLRRLRALRRFKENEVAVYAKMVEQKDLDSTLSQNSE